MVTETSRYQLPTNQLEHSGPFIPVAIENTIGAALLDTGARHSLIDILVARELNLPEIGAHQITGVTGAGEFPLFQTEIQIPWLGIAVPSPIQGAPLKTNNIPWHAIIGRDILLQFDFRVDGPSGTVTFFRDTVPTE